MFPHSRALIDTSNVNQDLKPYLPLFAAFLSKLGAKHLNYQALDTEIELTTGNSSQRKNSYIVPAAFYLPCFQGILKPLIEPEIILGCTVQKIFV